MENKQNNEGFIPAHGGYRNLITYLLSRQIKTLETAFINEGGLRERMTKARTDKRNKR